MDEASGNFQTQRARYAAKYEASGKPYIVSTKPLHSTLSLEFEVVDLDVTNQFAFAVARAGQTLDFFSYGTGESVLFGAVQRKANDADTNLSKAKSTNGAADLVIEGLSFKSGASRYLDGAGVGASEPFPAQTDKDVIKAIAGGAVLYDPASIVTPPQVQSPFNLENPLLNAVLRSMSVQLNWDDKRMEKLGHVLNLPQGGAGSQLRANGMPLASNIFRIPEGYIWAKDGDPDSEMIVRCKLEEPVVIPINLNDNPANEAQVIAPASLYLDITLAVHGFEFKFPSGN